MIALALKNRVIQKSYIIEDIPCWPATSTWLAIRLKVFVRSLTLIFSCLAFSACNKSKAADEATEAVESDKVEKFSLSSLVEAFLELVVEAMEALDRLVLKKGNLVKGTT